MHKILLCEDEPKLCKVIKDQLDQKGYLTDCALDGKMAQIFFEQDKYSLAIIDINLPLKSGLELCKEFRLINKNIPIIMLTALGDIDTKIESFNLGADDYIIKPFHIDELVARVNVFLKRNIKEEKNVDKELLIEDLRIVYKSKSVYRGNTEIILTPKEFQLLTLLAENRGKLVSKKEILDRVWDIQKEQSNNTVEVHISFLRNKIDKPFTNKLIYTKSGAGYCIK